ncbi:hypothetical protein KZC52_11605 [Microbacterium sp. kSW2-24]|uniref:Pycsar system effector family protein n=1 Tax=Microbacterium galbinum TaxID=2851646 RepID=UPI001FFD3294|nr:Pycsar system effector family protein [Microbacterium galbinum]MCK2023573.1 hypothetical protein [Microbacterium galbinum]
MRNPLDAFRRRSTTQTSDAVFATDGATETPDVVAAVVAVPEPQVKAAPDPNPEHAWKALALVNEWIRHADAKAAVTLAFTGVLGTMTFNLVKDFQHRTFWFDALVVLACVFLVAAGALCGWTLTPRFTEKRKKKKNSVDQEVEVDDVVNRLFYGSITKGFKDKRHQYSDVMRALTADPVELTRDLSDQIHTNAGIATTKNFWVKWAIRTALLAGAAVTAVAVLIGASNG